MLSMILKKLKKIKYKVLRIKEINNESRERLRKAMKNI
jgi:hypothetical protein